MTSLRIILHDQLSDNISSLEGLDSSSDIILMPELLGWAAAVKHHKKKLVLLFSAMRHFANQLQDKKINVVYIKIEDNILSLKDAVLELKKQYEVDRIIITKPSEYSLWQDAQKLNEISELEIREDTRFLASTSFFINWAEGRKSLLMEYFYRSLRVKYDILMEGKKPVGGKWNYDASNRKPPKSGLEVPKPFSIEPDEITKNVIATVETKFPNHFGNIKGFHFAVTRSDALLALDNFINNRLVLFGDYQDAMVTGEAWMYHSHISFYLNCGLLLPLECINLAVDFYNKGSAPLNAVEGFVRQILGWREFVRGIYWFKMPQYKELNYFGANRNLPSFYWDGNTDMNCLSQCVNETYDNAYAHHIQRLMVLGNFALIAGINPQEVNDWFLVVYADAYEWVELPNVSGMILFADGGYLASKPYAAGGSYINKMSDYCRGCKYKVSEKNGGNACPFNYLYWDFLSRNRDKLIKNHRIGMMYKIFDRMDEKKKNAILHDSEKFLDSLF
ncbi:MAG: cryptochrome/photolyase family protein [Legionellales bacterium]|jgi:deoxyribodipyrimidine photolyase-related protein|nr:cryptochrome/photolyase family protein [Legionellales bacterium]